MLRALLLLSMSLLASNASAQRVYKCQDGQQTIYQSLPCAQEQDTGVSHRVVSDPRLSPEERRRNEQMLRQARTRMQAEAGRGQKPAQQGTVIENLADPERCEDTRWRHELSRTFGRSDTDAVARELPEACRRN